MAVKVKISEKCFSPDYTPLQVVHSLTRKLAWVTLNGDESEIRAYERALAKARKALTAAHSVGFIPCGPECMSALPESECNCHCGGVNHGKVVLAA